jgi:hypothetical protein
MIGKMNQGRASDPGEMMVSGDCQEADSGELCSAHGIKFPTPDPMLREQSSMMDIFLNIHEAAEAKIA